MAVPEAEEEGREEGVAVVKRPRSAHEGAGVLIAGLVREAYGTSRAVVREQTLAQNVATDECPDVLDCERCACYLYVLLHIVQSHGWSLGWSSDGEHHIVGGNINVCRRCGVH